VCALTRAVFSGRRGRISVADRNGVKNKAKEKNEEEKVGGQGRENQRKMGIHSQHHQCPVPAKIGNCQCSKTTQKRDILCHCGNVCLLGLS